GSVNLLAKEFSHEWMGIELHGVARIVPGNEARSSKFGNHHSPFRRAQTHQWFRKPRYWRFPSEDGKHPFVYGTVKKTQHPEDGNLRPLTKPRLVGSHDFARVRSLPRVTRQVFGHFLAQPYISVISVSKKTTEQRECQTMATEFLTCRLQLLFRSLDAQRAQQFCTGVARDLFEISSPHGSALVFCDIGDWQPGGDHAKPIVEQGERTQ